MSSIIDRRVLLHGVGSSFAWSVCPVRAQAERERLPDILCVGYSANFPLATMALYINLAQTLIRDAAPTSALLHLEQTQNGYGLLVVHGAQFESLEDACTWLAALRRIDSGLPVLFLLKENANPPGALVDNINANGFLLEREQDLVLMKAASLSATLRRHGLEKWRARGRTPEVLSFLDFTPKPLPWRDWDASR